MQPEKKTWRSKDGQDYILTGIGHTTNGKITTVIEIKNPNFEVVTDEAADSPVVGTVSQQNPQLTNPADEQTANTQE